MVIHTRCVAWTLAITLALSALVMALEYILRIQVVGSFKRATFNSTGCRNSDEAEEQRLRAQIDKLRAQLAARINDFAKLKDLLTERGASLSNFSEEGHKEEKQGSFRFPAISTPGVNQSLIVSAVPLGVQQASTSYPDSIALPNALIGTNEKEEGSVEHVKGKGRWRGKGREKLGQRKDVVYHRDSPEVSDLLRKVEDLQATIATERRQMLQRLTQRLEVLPDEKIDLQKRMHDAKCPGSHERIDEWPHPKNSPLKTIVVIVHRLHVTRLTTAREKLRTIESYRPYFFDLVYLQPIAKTPETEAWLRATLGPWLFDCAPNYVGPEDFHKRDSNRKGWYDRNGFACVGRLIKTITSYSNAVVDQMPPGLLGLAGHKDNNISGLLYIHADFWITPMLLMNFPNRHSMEDLWLVRWGVGSGKNAEEVKQMRQYWCGPWSDGIPHTPKKEFKKATEDALRELQHVQRWASAKPAAVCSGWADLFYVPRRAFDDWADLSQRFEGLYNEIAIPTMARILQTQRHYQISWFEECFGRTMTYGKMSDLQTYPCGHRLPLNDVCCLEQLKRFWVVAP